MIRNHTKEHYAYVLYFCAFRFDDSVFLTTKELELPGVDGLFCPPFLLTWRQAALLKSKLLSVGMRDTARLVLRHSTASIEVRGTRIVGSPTVTRFNYRRTDRQCIYTLSRVVLCLLHTEQLALEWSCNGKRQQQQEEDEGDDIGVATTIVIRMVLGLCHYYHHYLETTSSSSRQWWACYPYNNRSSSSR